MWGRPILRAIREGGTANIFAGPIGRRLISCTVTDQAGQESDTATILCADPGRQLPLPAKGEKYSVYMGWQWTGPVLQGEFEVQTTTHGGSEAGEFLTINLRAADFIEGLKASVRKDYPPDTTVAELFGDVAEQAGLSGAVVPPALASVKLGYRLQWDQSRIDFATEIAQELGAVVKPAGGKLVLMQGGAGQSGSGADLQTIQIRKRAGYGWEIEIEPRPVYGNVCAAWQDPETGRRKLATQATGRSGPFHVLQHPFMDEEAAKRAAAAGAFDLGNNAGSGYFESPGLPFARAEAPVIATGYGDGIDGRWKAESIEKVVTGDGGFRTTVSVGAGKEAK